MVGMLIYIAAAVLVILAAIRFDIASKRRQGARTTPAERDRKGQVALLTSGEQFTSSLTVAEGLLPDIDIEDYLIWVTVAKTQRPQIHEFTNQGTPAAILWSNKSNMVGVVANKNIVSGSPKTDAYDLYEYEIEEKYWASGAGPRGSAAVIKKVISELIESGRLSLGRAAKP